MPSPMALFNKPPAKKSDAPPPSPKPAPAGEARRAPVSARDVAAQAQGRRGGGDMPRAEPMGDFSMTGASLMESPGRTSIEVAQSGAGMCAVLENAALLYASGQSKPARDLLEQGVQTDPDAKNSPLAWLALFDLQQRTDDRAAFDKLALLYVVQFERSPPVWEESGKQPANAVKAPAGGYAVLTGKLTAASAPQVDTVRKQVVKSGQQTRLDLAQVQGFDDAGARLLAELLAEARKRRTPLKLERYDKIRNTLEILVRRGREAGEGAWLLSLELLQFENKQEAFDDRAIEYAVAFEQSPPSWEPPPAPPVSAAPAAAPADAEELPANVVAWTGAMTGPSSSAMTRIVESAFSQPYVVLDLSAVQRIDFVCAGALLNAIGRVEQQRKAVQIMGASPIIRALLLLIGISPRHFLKKPQ
jgi:ABC-type transporter Mla MlaB component